MKDILFKDQNKSKNMSPNLVNLHSSLFSCYSQSEQKNTPPGPESGTPKIGVSFTYYDDNLDVVTTHNPSQPSISTVYQSSQITNNISKVTDIITRRSSNTSDITIG
jgi:hypothetical protein